MSVTGYNVYIFACTCNGCGISEEVRKDENKGIYNAAQAVRSLGWSYGRDNSVKCDKCRRNNKYDGYRSK